MRAKQSEAKQKLRPRKQQSAKIVSHATIEAGIGKMKARAMIALRVRRFLLSQFYCFCEAIYWFTFFIRNLDSNWR